PAPRIPRAAAPAAAACAVVRAFRDIRQERHLAGALHGLRDLHLVAPARAGDAPAADLPPLRDVAPELVDVLVVDLGDLLLAEEAVPPPDLAGRPAGLPALRWLGGLLSGQAAPRRGCRRRLRPGGGRRPRRRPPARTGCRRRHPRRRRGRRGTGRCRR